MDKGKKLFYGWWVVIAITFVFFTAGAAPFAIVLKQLLEQFHTGRGEVSLSQSIMMISIGVTGIFVGRLMQRYRPRTFILWGTIVTGVTYLLLSLTNSLWFLYVFYLIIGFAAGLSNAIAYATLLSKWFARNWGTAVGIIMAGGSVGVMVIQPLVGIAASRAVKMIFRHKAGYPVEFGLTINQRTFAIKGYDKFLRSVAC
jgi:sugar phosphate permease